jgi:CRP/FNR family transcriptional regulator
MSVLASKTEKAMCQNCASLAFSLLGSVQETELASLSDHKVCNRYPKGQMLAFEGNQALGLYCIKAGTFKVYKTSIDGKEQIIRLVRAGEFVGYRALIADEPYSASVESIEDSQVCFIPRDYFMNMLQRNAELSRTLTLTLCHELGVAQERLMNMAQKSVRERLAETLLIMQATANRNRTAEEGPIDPTLCIQLPREDIANLTGSSTETIIRLLTEFKEDGWVELKGKQIRITNPGAVAKQARMVA